MHAWRMACTGINNMLESEKTVVFPAADLDWKLGHRVFPARYRALFGGCRRPYGCLPSGRHGE